MMVEQGIIENCDYHLKFGSSILRSEKMLEYYDIEDENRIYVIKYVIGG